MKSLHYYQIIAQIEIWNPFDTNSGRVFFFSQDPLLSLCAFEIIATVIFNHSLVFTNYSIIVSVKHN